MDEPENQDKPKPGEQRPVSKMTAEEQMAAIAKAMKEDDWGHQPC